LAGAGWFALSLKQKVLEIESRIFEAESRAGRKKGSVRLLFATKYASAKDIAELASIKGSLLIGESKVQDAKEKFSSLLLLLGKEKLSLIEKHMIGTLQANKVPSAMRLFDCIQSIDSLALAQKVSNRADGQREMPIFIQASNGEPSKRGIRQEELDSAIQSALRLPGIRVVGLMGIGIMGNENATRGFFRLLRKKADEFGLMCSMGMSSDFEIAIEEGSDMVRIGRTVFGD
jgi:pyridoxal phosphate enzyme (YggS family)